MMGIKKMTHQRSLVLLMVWFAFLGHVEASRINRVSFLTSKITTTSHLSQCFPAPQEKKMPSGHITVWTGQAGVSLLKQMCCCYESAIAICCMYIVLHENELYVLLATAALHCCVC